LLQGFDNIGGISLPSILVFNEDAGYLSNLAKGLQKAQYIVTPVAQPGQVFVQLQRDQYDLLILDICPAGWHEDRFLTEIRRKCANLPMIAITDTPCLETALYALRHKVYDYLEKKIPPDTLLIRIQEVLIESRGSVSHIGILNQMQALLDSFRNTETRTSNQENLLTDSRPDVPNTNILRGPYTVNMNTRKVSCGEKQVVLSPTEFNYWLTLLRHEPEVISYKLLVKEAQNYDLGGREAMNLARWHIHGLRKIFENELGKDPIQTVRGVGYRVLV
jgi:DNA-binding response OmpR family regulator